MESSFKTAIENEKKIETQMLATSMNIDEKIKQAFTTAIENQKINDKKQDEKKKEAE